MINGLRQQILIDSSGARCGVVRLLVLLLNFKGRGNIKHLRKETLINNFLIYFISKFKKFNNICKISARFGIFS